MCLIVKGGNCKLETKQILDKLIAIQIKKGTPNVKNQLKNIKITDYDKDITNKYSKSIRYFIFS